MFDWYPRTDFHELNLDWFLIHFKKIIRDLVKTDEKYNEILKLFDNLEEGIGQIVDDYLAEARNIALRTDLTSNDIDIEEKFTYQFVDGRRLVPQSPNFIVFQSMVLASDGKIITVANDETDQSDSGVIRVYDPDTGVNISEFRGKYVGHAQDCTIDDNDILYVAHSINYQGLSQKLVSKFQYPTMDMIGTIPLELPIEFSNISYNWDKDNFILKYDNRVYIFDKALQNEVESFIITDEFAKEYGGNDGQKFVRVSRQGTFYYNNMLACIYSYPNAICFYDLDTHKMVKMYNPPYTIGTGGIFDEIECGYIMPNSDGDVWLTAFNISADARHAQNVLAVWNPYKNDQTLYRKYARNIAPINIYVDGSTLSAKQYGSLNHPYQNMTQAVAACKSFAGTETPINIYCKAGTNCGALRATQTGFINVNIYEGDTPGAGTTPYILEGVRIISTSQVYIRGANIKFNKQLGNEQGGVCHFDRVPLGELINCSIVGTDPNYSTGNIATYGITATNGTNLIVRNTSGSGYSTAGIYCASMSEVSYDAQSVFANKDFVQYLGKVSTVATKYHGNANTYNDALPEIETYVLSNDSINSTGTYDLFEHTQLANSAKQVVNYLAFDVGTLSGGYHQTCLLRCPSDITTSINFRFAVPSGANAVETIAGSVQMSSGNLTISQIGSNVKIYQIQGF